MREYDKKRRQRGRFARQARSIRGTRPHEQRNAQNDEQASPDRAVATAVRVGYPGERQPDAKIRLVRSPACASTVNFKHYCYAIELRGLPPRWFEIAKVSAQELCAIHVHLMQLDLAARREQLIRQGPNLGPRLQRLLKEDIAIVVRSPIRIAR